MGRRHFPVVYMRFGSDNTDSQCAAGCIQRMSCTGLNRLMVGSLAVGVLSSLAAAALEVNVTRVGFATLQSGDVVRPGMWTPLIVDVSLVNQATFDGLVRVGQLDLDGDEAFDSMEIHLNAATGGHERIMLLTLPSFSGRQGRLVVEVLTPEGETVEIVSQGEISRQALPGQPPEPINDDELLILSVSTGTVGKLSELTRVDQEGGYARPLQVAHMSPAELPEHWVGLEAVDAIRWDDANPAQITQKQVAALTEWVQQGGILVLTVSSAEGSFALKKSMDEVLPAEPGEARTIQRLDHTFTRLLQPFETSSEEHEGFAAPLAALRFTKREGSEVLANEASIDSDLVTRKRFGRGWVVLCGMNERDLFAANGSPSDFYRRVFLLERGNAGNSSRPDTRTLFGEVVSAVSFSTSGGLYLALAALFSVGYVAVATLGSWAFLVARGWKHHSWTAFALVAVLASVATVFGVNSIRGFGEKLHQITIVDAESDKGYGFATTLFGLKTGTDRELDLWLPGDGLAVEPTATSNYLRPIRPVGGTDAGMNSFADPQTYRLSPSTAELQDVRLRATLKQFEGRWQGRIGGKVSAKITIAPRKPGEFGWLITDDSYIINGLSVPLRNCYLLQPLADTFASWDRTFEQEDDDGRGAFESDRDRGARINAFPIGDLPADGTRVTLTDRCYKPMTGARLDFQEVLDWKLDAAHKSWNKPLEGPLRRGFGGAETTTVSLGNERNALLVLSTLGDFSPDTIGTIFGEPITWSHDGLRHLDLREQLQRDSVYLIGFADEPGPVRLYRRQGDRAYSPIDPEPRESWTMYRIRIPVTLAQGAVPATSKGP